MAAVARIFTKPFRSVHIRAVNSVAAMPTCAIKSQIDVHEASGEDLAMKSSLEFAAWQRQLVQYRWDRLKEEIAVVKTGGVSLATTTFKEYVRFLRLLTRMLATFVLCTMVGRRSIFPLLPPDSKLYDANEKNVLNPKKRKAVGLR